MWTEKLLEELKTESEKSPAKQLDFLMRGYAAAELMDDFITGGMDENDLIGMEALRLISKLLQQIDELTESVNVLKVRVEDLTTKMDLCETRLSNVEK